MISVPFHNKFSILLGHIIELDVYPPMIRLFINRQLKNLYDKDLVYISKLLIRLQTSFTTCYDDTYELP